MWQLSPWLRFDINLRHAKQKYSWYSIIQEIKEEIGLTPEIKEEEITISSLKIKIIKIKE
jgi:hypothetical protein